MRIISKSRLQEFYEKHADAKVPLNTWAKLIKNLELSSLNDIKKIFGSADIIGNNRVVFDIKGNRYRIISVIKIQGQRVYIRWIGTHAEYDKIDAKSI